MKEKKIVFEKLTVEEKDRVLGGGSPQGPLLCMEDPVGKPKNVPTCT